MRNVVGWVLILGISVPLAAEAQQQYGDPTNYPGTYLTQRTSPLQPVDVTYFVGSGFTAPQWNLINQAATIWNNAADGSVRLIQIGVGGADITFSSVNLNDATTNLARHFLTTIPGAGTYPDGTPWRTITNTLIEIDSDPPGAPPYYVGTGSPVGRFDFLSLMLREFGLALGLGFANADPGSVMDSNLAPGEQHLTLSAGDIGALQTLYGTPEPATWALFGVGLLMLGAARKIRRA